MLKTSNYYCSKQLYNFDDNKLMFLIDYLERGKGYLKNIESYLMIKLQGIKHWKVTASSPFPTLCPVLLEHSVPTLHPDLLPSCLNNNFSFSLSTFFAHLIILNPFISESFSLLIMFLKVFLWTERAPSELRKLEDSHTLSLGQEKQLTTFIVIDTELMWRS